MKVLVEKERVMDKQVMFPISTRPGEGWAECKVRPPCSEKDYFQIHTACDSEGRVSSLGQWFFNFHRSTSIHGFLFCLFWVFFFTDAGVASLDGA